MKPLYVENLFPAGTVMNATRNSVAQPCYSTFSMSIQIEFTGTPTGNFKLQSSADRSYSGVPTANGSGLNAPPVKWSDVANSTFNVAGAGDVMWDYYAPGFNWIRVVYTDTSGGTSTATITVSKFNAKEG